MSRRVCSLLMAGVYLVGMADALIHTTFAFCLCFCASNEINHFLCGFPPLLLISCSDTQVNELVIFTILGYHYRSPCLLLLYHPISLKDPLSWGESHSSLYLRLPPNCCGNFPGNYALYVFQTKFFLLSRSSKMTSLFYTLVIPMLNALIYSLRNKDVKEALEKLKNKWL